MKPTHSVYRSLWVVLTILLFCSLVGLVDALLDRGDTVVALTPGRTPPKGLYEDGKRASAREGGERNCLICMLKELSGRIEQHALTDGVAFATAFARWQPGAAEASKLREDIAFTEKHYVRPADRGRVRLRVVTDPDALVPGECLAYVAKRFRSRSADDRVFIGLTVAGEIVELLEEPGWPSKNLDTLVGLDQ